MITIYCCANGSKKLYELGDFGNSFLHKSNHKQWRYIKDVNKSNGCIATLPHKKSVLRRYFIEPHLNESGYIKEYGKFSLNLIGFTIYYELIDQCNIIKQCK